MTRWDHSEPRETRIGSPAVILEWDRASDCQSGLMVTVRGPTDREITIDSDWVKPK